MKLTEGRSNSSMLDAQVTERPKSDDAEVPASASSLKPSLLAGNSKYFPRLKTKVQGHPAIEALCPMEIAALFWRDPMISTSRFLLLLMEGRGSLMRSTMWMASMIPARKFQS